MTSTRLFSILKYLLLFCIGLLLLWLTFKDQDVKEIFIRIQNADFLYIAISVLLGFIAFVLRAWRWNLLLEPLGYRVRILPACYALAIGYFANLAIPRIGEITRCGILNKSENIPFEKLIGTVIIERVIDLMMLAVALVLAGILGFSLLKGFLNDKVISPFLNKPEEQSDSWKYIVFAAVILACGILVFIIMKSKRMHLLKNRIRIFLSGIITGLRSVFKMKQPGLFTLQTFLIWFLYFLATYVGFFALKSTSHLGMREGIFVLVAGGMGMTAPVQGGIGAYHYIVSQCLQLFHIPLSEGITYATLAHTSQTLLVILLGIVALFLVFRSKKNILKHDTENNNI